MVPRPPGGVTGPAAPAPPRDPAVAESVALARHMLLVAAPLGLLVGVAIAAYDWVINELLWPRVAGAPIAVQLAAPFAGLLLTGIILRLTRTPSPSMADEVVRSYHDPGEGMPTGTAPGKLLASVATLGLGGSAGMEGASKWLGATVGSLVQARLNRLGLRAVHGSTKTTLLAGGAAGIAAIFRAPLSGAIMGIESPYQHDLAHEALLPALVASATSFWAFTRLRPATPYFPVQFHYTLSSRDLLVAAVLGLVAGLASHLFLWTLAQLRRRLDATGLPVPVRTGLGGLALVALAALAWAWLGQPVTLGAGLPVARELLAGRWPLWAALAIFCLKMLATAVTFGSGGVGGLFVPTATMGAALGACFDAVLAPSHPGVYTLLGIAAFSGASYNSLLFAAVFVAEATGNAFLVVPSLVASSVAFVVTAGVSNSRSQRRRRPGWRDRLRSAPVAAAMTRDPVAARPDETLEQFSRAVLLDHHLKALPVVDGEGVLLGMVGLVHLRSVPAEEWGQVRVGQVLDAEPEAVGPADSVADAEAALRRGPYGAVPVVEPGSRRLVGVISRSDVLRALAEPPASAA